MTESRALPVPADDEIDLGQLAAALRRRWPVLLGGMVAGGLLAAQSTAFTKPTWEAEFQIVLSNEQSKGSGLAAALLSQNAGLASLLGAGAGSGGADQQATEVKILESPSVLLPIYTAVKASKPVSDTADWRFDTWVKGAVEVEPEKGTSVLTVRFRDTDQALVLPISRRISQAYQTYSGRSRSREIRQLEAYLDAQIAQLRPRSEAATRAAQSYAADHSLSVADGLPLSGSLKAAGGVDPEQEGRSIDIEGGANLEARRTALQQRLNALEVQISQARKAGAQVLYIASETAARTDKGSSFDQLTLVETELAEKRSRLRPNDPIVQRLERERQSLILYINQQTIALLEGEIILNQANLQSLERPKAVVLRHRELTQKALRLEATLVELENNRAKFQLEKARQTDPWELISTPTLLDKPVAPRPARNLALGLLAGLVLGSGAALVVDRRTDLVFASDELRGLLPYPLLAELRNSSDPSLTLLAQGPLAGAPQVALVPVGAIPEGPAIAKALQAALQQQDPAAQVLLTTDLAVAGRCQVQLLITAPGAASRRGLRKLQQDLQLQGHPVAGLLLVLPEPTPEAEPNFEVDAA
ncbi:MULTISPECIES: Wzz/FepE/Etk N-terminal domain-containing protein [Cyanobium]|uniref:Polysaccharide chain length determinant N-terminal domain-containing protein n=1 Tax=Cyanobium usitatum str. Tous TaxID=2116684 RepID=A0A2P7N1L2_9CYAN|nr:MULTISPECIES: Wzz/FepE/Etk N-terminal domain-containing protein [Cyanobium]MCP9779127.1 hypothetical protein [Cyanobium sp. To12R1]PSJ07316.1 hypothetical protein C7K55_00805 [Cyanobium usitatum str. Tous]